MNQETAEAETETEYVRDLLGRAVDEIRVPMSRGSETVFAKASRLRWRRRATASGAVVAATAAGLLLGPGMPGTGHGAGAASSPTAGGHATKADRFAKLLPPGTGRISEISLARVMRQSQSIALPKPLGRYGGDYAVTRPEGVGYISVHIATRSETDTTPGDEGPENPCTDAATDGRIDCTTQKLSDGALLGVWETPAADSDMAPEPSGGREYDAVLRLKDGRSLTVRAGAGLQGKGRLGPLLTAPPLTRAQLAKLIQNPALLK
ncbi:hypothetical protein [Streptomyces sp. NPDC059371]|uniref:hypothetical protein n=1 Tax=Streptomyces sp. NPDC059371 TaxID=3346812 RepID=UPI0036C5149C